MDRIDLQKYAAKRVYVCRPASWFISRYLGCTILVRAPFDAMLDAARCIGRVSTEPKISDIQAIVPVKKDVPRLDILVPDIVVVEISNRIGETPIYPVQLVPHTVYVVLEPQAIHQFLEVLRIAFRDKCLVLSSSSSKKPRSHTAAGCKSNPKTVFCFFCT